MRVGWRLQKYGYVPGLSNVRAQAPPGSTSGELHAPSGLGSFPDTALWAMAPTFTQRTVSPGLMVTVAGSLKYSPIDTVYVAGAAVVGATVVVVGAAVVVVVVGTVVVLVVVEVVVVVVDVDVVVDAVVVVARATVVVVEVAGSVVVVVEVVVVVVGATVVVVGSSASDELHEAALTASAAAANTNAPTRRLSERVEVRGGEVIRERGGSLHGLRQKGNQPTARRYCRTVSGKNTMRIAAIHRRPRHP